MAFRKTKDLAVTTGKYIDKEGKEKSRYQNIGYILEGDEGQKMIMINRSFNPAGVPFKEGSDTIIVSQFDVKDKNAAPAQQSAPAPATFTSADMDDGGEIPF